MLGQAETTAYLTATPKPRASRPDRPAEPALVDGVTMLAGRRAPRAIFIALHEPFEDEPTIARFERIAQTPHALAVRVVGRPGSRVNDRILLRIADEHDQPITLGDDHEQFTFADFAYIRVGPKVVAAGGDLRSLKLNVGATRPNLVVNDKSATARFAGGIITWQQ
jgi:hypothetical protein